MTSFCVGPSTGLATGTICRVYKNASCTPLPIHKLLLKPTIRAHLTTPIINQDNNGQLPLSLSTTRLLLQLAFFASSPPELRRVWPRPWTLPTVPIPVTVARTILWTREAASSPASPPVCLQPRQRPRRVRAKLLSECEWRRRWHVPWNIGNA